MGAIALGGAFPGGPLATHVPPGARGSVGSVNPVELDRNPVELDLPG
jgi:hypothetical protein